MYDLVSVQACSLNLPICYHTLIADAPLRAPPPCITHGEVDLEHVTGNTTDVPGRYMYPIGG